MNYTTITRIREIFQKPEPKPQPKTPYNALTISLKTGPDIVFHDTDPKHKDKPHKSFQHFVKWFTNSKSKRYYIFEFDKGLRMLRKSEIVTFNIQSLEEK